MNISQYLQGLIANYLLGTDFPVPPSALELALSSTDPHIALTEVGVRQTVTFGTVSNRATSNTSSPVWFPVSGSITHVAVFDAGTGEMLFAAPLAVAVNAPTGGTFSFAIGDVRVELTAKFGEAFANSILSWMVGTPMPAAPTTVYAEISTNMAYTPPQTTNGYAKQPISFVTPFPFTSGVGTIIENLEDVLFPVAHTNPWGNITHVMLTTGTATLFTLQLSASKYVAVGESVGFANNSLSFVLG